MFNTTPITFIILIVTIIVSWRAFQNSALFEKLLHNPYRVKHHKEYYRIFSHALIHADFMHLGLNMFVFYSFGTVLETYFKGLWGTTNGSLYFIVLYVLGAAVAAVPSMRKHGDNYAYNAVGASGAVSAILMAFMILNPLHMIAFFFIPMPAFIGVFVFFILEHFMKKSGKTNIAHDAHIWGALFGITFMFLLDTNTLVNFISQVRGYIGI